MRAPRERGVGPREPKSAGTLRHAARIALGTGRSRARETNDGGGKGTGARATMAGGAGGAGPLPNVDDFNAMVAVLGPPAICTPYQRAHAVCPWYHVELRSDLMDKMTEIVNDTDLHKEKARIVLLGTQILEAAVAAGAVREHDILETARVALTLASKLTERWFVSGNTKTQRDVLGRELALLDALAWRIPRDTPFYILAVLCDEVVDPPKKLHKKAHELLGVLMTTSEYCRLRRRAVAAGVAFCHALVDLADPVRVAAHVSAYRIPDPHNEAPRMKRALERAVGATSPIVA